MSFTTDVKNELARVEPTCTHCDKAMLAALVRIEGSLVLTGKGGMRLEIDTDSPNVARLMVRLLHTIYSLETELVVRRSVLHKTPNYLISVPAQAKLPESLRDLGVLGDTGFEAGISKKLIAKNCCAAAYLRGVFLARGFVSNPRGDFHFEMTVESEELARDIADLLHERGINARYLQRRNNYIVYLKSGTAISDFLALVGAHQCALAMESERVIKSVRNDVNRRVNADVANQKKASDAGIDQIIMINKVVGHYGFENLSPALQEFIRLRAAHPDASLKELGEYADPKLSKSAVYHRVRRLEQMAEQINSPS